MDKNNKYLDAHKEIVTVARLSIYSNTILLFIKLITGILMGSVGVLSEALHSGIDLLAAFIANYSVGKAGQPADREHKFGHGKFENVSCMVESLLIFLAAIIILYESGKKLLEGSKVEFVGAGIIIMGLSAIINIIVSRKIMNVAKKAESIALEADAYHLTTDVYTSVGILVGLVLIKLTGNSIYDPIMAIIVASMITKTSYDLLKKSIVGLMDMKLSDKEEETIMSIISDHSSQHIEYHALRTRMSGAERFVDLHLVMPKDMHIKDVHNLCDHIEKDIMEKISNLSITIHVEPCNANCDICNKLNMCKNEKS
jgi:cation diffusion facilitator family transporter